MTDGLFSSTDACLPVAQTGFRVPMSHTHGAWCSCPGFMKSTCLPSLCVPCPEGCNCGMQWSLHCRVCHNLKKSLPPAGKRPWFFSFSLAVVRKNQQSSQAYPLFVDSLSAPAPFCLLTTDNVGKDNELKGDKKARYLPAVLKEPPVAGPLQAVEWTV